MEPLNKIIPAQAGINYLIEMSGIPARAGMTKVEFFI